jgi:CHAT domain-containing protein/uncharacterized protein HemY/outer membrane protein assembly factor BamD (BamD/ComL family)
MRFSGRSFSLSTTLQLFILEKPLMKLSLRRFQASSIALFLAVAALAPSSPMAFWIEPVIAQTADARKVEADRLFQQGNQQIQKAQYQAASQSLEQALRIYREIQNRLGEVRSLLTLAAANLGLGNNTRAVELSQQAVAIAKELKNPKLEKVALQALEISQKSAGSPTQGSPQKVEADRLFQQGIQQYQINQYEAALKSWQQALQIYRKIKDRRGEGATLGNLGLAYDDLSNYDQAISYHVQSLDLSREIKDRRGEITSLGNLGNAYFSLGSYRKAIEYQERSLEIAQEVKDREGEGKALGNLGNAYQFLGNYGKAIEYLEKTLVIAREIKDRKIEGAALGNLGLSYYSLGNYGKAVEYHKRSLEIAREIKDRQGEGQSLTNLGNAQTALGNYDKAIEYHKRSLEVVREIKDRYGEGSVLGNLGITYKALGNYSKAIEYQEQALAIAREIKDRRGEGNALSNLGSSYDSLGQYIKAIEYQEQALAIAQEIKDRHGEGSALGNLGLTYDVLGNYGKAIEYQEQALLILRDIKNRQGEGDVLGNLGLAYYSLGNYGKAIKYYEQRLSIAREIKDRKGEGSAQGNLGNVYLSLENYRTAIEYLERTLVSARELKDRQGKGGALSNLGNAYSGLGNYEKAINYQEQSLAILREIKDRQGEGVALGNLGSAYKALGNYPKAISYQEQSLAIAREIKDLQGEGVSLNNLGVTLFKAGNLPAATRILKDGIAIWEMLRQTVGRNDANKVSIFEGQLRTYRTLQEVLIAQNQPNAALEISERGRARAFVELLSRRLVKDSKTNLSTTAVIQSAVTSLTLKQIQQIAQVRNATLVQYSIIYDNFKIQNKDQVHEASLYIWVINPTGAVTFRQTDLKPLWQQQKTALPDLVATTRDIIGARSRCGGVCVEPDAQTLAQQRQIQGQNLQQLHKLLIEPIADLLPKDPTDRVIFIPQGELFLVPFPALQDNTGKSLIDQYTILTAPSIQVLDLTRQQRDRQKTQPSNRTTLVVGNPIMPKVRTQVGGDLEQLTNLAGAEQEAQDIAKLFNTTVILGANAKKSAIVPQLSSARIIHLATHGLLDDFKGLGVPGAIALGPDGTGKENDGLLTADEILDLKLNAELVVLSACDTGRGRITGDGVIGLSRSLITAGVPSIIVSLWKVPDASTAFLMTEFYKNLQQTPDKAQALRQAMLTTKAKYPDPLDWAAFTLIGESE